MKTEEGFLLRRRQDFDKKNLKQALMAVKTYLKTCQLTCFYVFTATRAWLKFCLLKTISFSLFMFSFWDLFGVALTMEFHVLVCLFDCEYSYLLQPFAFSFLYFVPVFFRTWYEHLLLESTVALSRIPERHAKMRRPIITGHCDH